MERRNFFRNMGIAAVGLSLPLHGVASSVYDFLADTDTEMLRLGHANEFSLLKLERLLPEYSYPLLESFDTNAYKHKYKLYNMYMTFDTYSGDFEIDAKAKGSEIDFSVVSSRLASLGQKDKSQPFSYYVWGNITAQNNLYATPLKWDLQSKIARNSINEEPYYNTGLKIKGYKERKKIHVSENSINRIVKIPNKNLSWKWGAIHMVQKMAENGIVSTKFSSIDEMDIVYDLQQLKLRREKLLPYGDKQLKFKIYDLTGDGVVPTVYWVDEYNRVVFIVTGQESFMLV